jgi:hypothetical protein
VCTNRISDNVPLTPRLIQRQPFFDFYFAGCAKDSSRKLNCWISVELVATRGVLPAQRVVAHVGPTRVRYTDGVTEVSIPQWVFQPIAA